MYHCHFVGPISPFVPPVVSVLCESSFWIFTILLGFANSSVKLLVSCSLFLVCSSMFNTDLLIAIGWWSQCVNSPRKFQPQSLVSAGSFHRGPGGSFWRTYYLSLAPIGQRFSQNVCLHSRTSLILSTISTLELNYFNSGSGEYWTAVEEKQRATVSTVPNNFNDILMCFIMSFMISMWKWDAFEAAKNR